MPSVGLKPATPQNEAGRIVEPPVCEPIANGAMPAATAAAEPDDEPPAVRPGSHGLRVTVGAMDYIWAHKLLPMGRTVIVR